MTDLDEHLPGRVVREKHHPATPMTVDQALHEMELVGHDFFLFQCAETGQPTVVYRRHAYDYGLIRLVDVAQNGAGTVARPAGRAPGRHHAPEPGREGADRRPPAPLGRRRSRPNSTASPRSRPGSSRHDAHHALLREPGPPGDGLRRRVPDVGVEVHPRRAVTQRPLRQPARGLGGVAAPAGPRRDRVADLGPEPAGSAGRAQRCPPVRRRPRSRWTGRFPRPAAASPRPRRRPERPRACRARGWR